MQFKSLALASLIGLAAAQAPTPVAKRDDMSSLVSLASQAAGQLSSELKALPSGASQNVQDILNKIMTDSRATGIVNWIQTQTAVPASEFAALSTATGVPSWFTALPSDLQQFVSSIGAEATAGLATGTAPAAPTKTPNSAARTTSFIGAGLAAGVIGAFFL